MLNLKSQHLPKQQATTCQGNHITPNLRSSKCTFSPSYPSHNPILTPFLTYPYPNIHTYTHAISVPCPPPFADARLIR